MSPKENEKVAVNYIYFGFFLVTLLITSLSSILLKEDFQGSRLFFFLYAAGQAFVEVSLFILISWLAKRFLNNFWFYLSIAMSFVFFTFHIVDFLLGRILDLATFDALRIFILDETFENFLYLLDASGIPNWGWILIFTSLGALPFLGVFFYYITSRFCQRRPLNIEWDRFIQVFAVIPFALFFWDFSASKAVYPDAYTAFTQSLPWKFTFLEPKSVIWSLPGKLKSPPLEITLKRDVLKDQTLLKKKPNIYLFVVESLRADSITGIITPHLSAFKKNAFHSDFSFSNGNGSHLSWFSLFHSQFPSLWSEMQKNDWQMGSPALNLLKKWGYKIRLYTSANLGYYKMDELLFGKERHLIDSYKTFYHTPLITASETDKKALESLKTDLLTDQSLQEGQVFIIFWDATHFDYSWPKDLPAKFVPFSNEFEYFKAFYTKEKVELIKNRYRNAVHYMDRLFGDFLKHLPRSDEAVVIFTGDHGEEFFDQGHLFHNSHLSQKQMHIPIFMKMGSLKGEKMEGVFSQMDIFPTLLHYLSGKAPSFLEGNSFFSEKKWPFALVARFNASRTPYEFCLHNGNYKLTFQFENRSDIFSPQKLHIRSFKNAQDKTVYKTQKGIEHWIDLEFGPAFHRLFSSEKDKG